MTYFIELILRLQKFNIKQYKSVSNDYIKEASEHIQHLTV